MQLIAICVSDGPSNTFLNDRDLIDLCLKYQELILLFDHFLQKKKQHEGQENALASVPQQWFQKLLGIQKV